MRFILLLGCAVLAGCATGPSVGDYLAAYEQSIQNCGTSTFSGDYSNSETSLPAAERRRVQSAYVACMKRQVRQDETLRQYPYPDLVFAHLNREELIRLARAEDRFSREEAGARINQSWDQLVADANARANQQAAISAAQSGAAAAWVGATKPRQCYRIGSATQCY